MLDVDATTARSIESPPKDFAGLLERIQDATTGPNDATSLARGGNVLTSAFADPVASAGLLDSWASGLEAGEIYDRGRSQMHNNGFSKISLVRLEGGWNLRLHVWPAGKGDQRVHDHRWSFASIAVAGALDVMNYAASPVADGDDDPTQRYRLYDATGDGEKRLERIEDNELRPSSSYRIGRGAFHILDYRDPHIVWNTTGEDAVTLMLSGPAQREYSHSYGPRDTGDVLPAPEIIGDARAIDHVRAVAQRLRAIA